MSTRAAYLTVPRFLCPLLSRSIHSQAKNFQRSDKPVKSPLVQNIDKLEAYIRSLQKVVKKKSTDHKKLQNLRNDAELDDAEVTAMYAALTTEQKPAISAPREVLSRKLCRIMSLPSSDTDLIDWSEAIAHLLRSSEGSHITTSDVNSLLKAMSHPDRIVHGETLLEKTSCRPNNLSFDLLMDSYATLAQMDKTLRTFDRLRGAGLTPSLYSYAHLMKACAVTKDLSKASAMYQYMQQQGIEPNLVISTSMIATCIRAKQVDQAFSIFDNLKYKSTSSAPDVHTYSLMIHACSLDKRLSAERASDLFQEMSERGLVPTRETYNALIHVYATRKEYFTEAWRLAEVMQRDNIEMDKVTWHSLLAACVMHGDINRARKLVKELMAFEATYPAWSVDAITLQLLFRAYASAKVRRSRVPDNILSQSLDMEKLAAAELWSHENPLSSDALLAESARVLQFASQEHPDLVDTQLIDTYMTISQKFEASGRFKNDWNTLYDDRRPKGMHSFELGLHAAYAFRDWELLQQVWAERLQWRSQQENNAKDHDHVKDFEATRLYIEALSRLNRVQQASDVLDEARTRYTFRKQDLKCFQTKSIQIGDEEAVLLYRQMFPEKSSPRLQSRYY